MIRTSLILMLALSASALRAEPRYTVEAGSWNSGYYFRHERSYVPIEDGWRNSQVGLDIATYARSGAADLLASYQQTGTSWPDVSERGWTGARAEGFVLITADTPGGPSAVDVVLNLRQSGQAVLSANADAQVTGGFEARVYATGGNANLIESFAAGLNAPAPTSVGQRMWRTGPDHLQASLHLPVGQPFKMSLVLYANGGSSGDGAVTVFGDFGLGFFEGAAVFDLPAGYDASSSDWGIENNQWCPGVCAAVPEPSAWLMLVAGLGGVALRTRRPWLARGAHKCSKRAI